MGNPFLEHPSPAIKQVVTVSPKHLWARVFWAETATFGKIVSPSWQKTLIIQEFKSCIRRILLVKHVTHHPKWVKDFFGVAFLYDNKSGVKWLYKINWLKQVTDVRGGVVGAGACVCMLSNPAAREVQDVLLGGMFYTPLWGNWSKMLLGIQWEVRIR